jgi:hypothetical protein
VINLAPKKVRKSDNLPVALGRCVDLLATQFLLLERYGIGTARPEASR